MTSSPHLRGGFLQIEKARTPYALFCLSLCSGPESLQLRQKLPRNTRKHECYVIPKCPSACAINYHTGALSLGSVVPRREEVKVLFIHAFGS